MRHLASGRPRTRGEVEELHRGRLAVADLVPGLGFWAGLMDGEFVGWWILEPPVRADQGPVAGQAELGYRLLRRHWRRGLAIEGARELVRHGFEDMALDRVFAETMSVNVASRATMAAIGMRHVRTFHPDFIDLLPGAELGEVEYAIERDQWLEQVVEVRSEAQPRNHHRPHLQPDRSAEASESVGDGYTPTSEAPAPDNRSATSSLQVCPILGGMQHL